jgi:uncharacterized protein with beta-barrel porin domain
LRGTSAAVLVAASTTLAFGVALPRQAQAGSVTPVQTTTYTLTTGNNPVTFATGADINSAGADGVYGAAGTSWTVSNQGTLSGAAYGLEIHGAGSTVTNAGLISGAGADGVVLAAGGAVANYAGGTITGAQNGIYVSGAATVTNDGAIAGTGTKGDGVFLHSGGVIGNTGTITGAGQGVHVYQGAGTVTNSGRITGATDAGVYLYQGGVVTNQAHGTVTGQTGIAGYGLPTTVTNAAVITGVTFQGVSLRAGGYVVNQTGGTITGATAGVEIGYDAGASTVTNAGVITGTTASVKFDNPGAGVLILQTGSTLNGDAVGTTAGGGSTALILQGAGTANNNFLNFNTLDVTAGGVWALNGVSTIGATTVDSGELRVGDAAHTGAVLTSPITINTGATLSGHGTVVGDVSNKGGTIAPGGSIGVLTITGNLTQSSASTMSIEIDPAINSALAVSGTASLAGSFVLVADPGIYRKGMTYTFLTAGSVTGTFSTLSANNGILFSEAQTTTTGTVTLLNGVSPPPTSPPPPPPPPPTPIGGFIPPQGATPNQIAVGGGVASVPVGASDFDTIANALVALGAGPGQDHILDELGAEIDPDFLTVARDNTRFVMGALGDQMSAVDEDGAVYRGRRLWGRAYGSFGVVGSDGNAHGFIDTSGGAVMGAARDWGPDATVGAEISYGHTDLRLRGLDQHGGFDTGGVGLYGEKRANVWFFDAAGAVAYDHGWRVRNILFAGIARRATGNFDGYAGAAQLAAGARVSGGGYVFEPSLTVTYSHVDQGRIAESHGGGADLNISAKVSRPVTLANGKSLRTDLKLAWAHEWSPTGTSLVQAFQAPGGSPFTVGGATPARDLGVVGAGLTYDASKRMTWYGRYQASFGRRETDNAVTAGFRFVW